MRTIETTYGRTDIEPTKVDISVRKRGNRSFVSAHFHAKGTHFRTVNMPLDTCKEVARKVCKVITKGHFPFDNGDGENQWRAFDPNNLSIGEMIAIAESK